MWRLRADNANERGAVAIIVALLVSSGILFGVAALTIDVGSLKFERRQLQNGADAAAMSVAQACVKDGVCPGAANSNLKNLVNNNANDKFTKIARIDGGQAVCGVMAPFATIASCAALTTNVQDCPVYPDPTKMPAQYVRVYTQTQISADDTKTILPYTFAQALAGGFTGSTQQSCATVGIGSLGSSIGAMPVVLAACAYDAMMAKNSPSFPPMPPAVLAKQLAPVGQMPASYAPYLTTFYTHTVSGPDTNDAMKCDKSTSGQFVSGGFGWTTTTDPVTCAANYTFDNGVLTMPAGNGAATPQGCKDPDGLLDFVGTTVYVPIVSGISADGNSYIIDGLAGFYVTGYGSPAAHPKNWEGYNNIPGIKGSDVGFTGWFTDEFISSGSFGSSLHKRGPKVLGFIQ